MRYRLKRSGQIVHVYRSVTKTPAGKTSNLTRAVVGRKGQEFENLPDHLVEEIESGSLDDIWEAVDGEATEEFDALGAEGSEPEPDPPEPEKTEGDPPEPVPHGHEADEGHEHEEITDKLSNERLTELVEMHALTVTGTGAQDKVVKGDMVKALLAEHGRE